MPPDPLMTERMALVLARENAQAPPENSDPFEILARREIEIGINIRGLPIAEAERILASISLNITIDFG
jgi:hypothetical protein